MLVVASWQTTELRVGDLARISGLQGRPALDGLVGRLAVWDGDRGRWHVEVATGDADGQAMEVETIALRPANLVAVVAADDAEGTPKDAAKAEAAAVDLEDAVEEIETPGARADASRAAGLGAGVTGGGDARGWRPVGPTVSAGVPSFMRDRLSSSHAHDDDLGGDDDSSDEERHEAALEQLPDLAATHELLTPTLIKAGKLGMRITDADGPCAGYALVDTVSEGPAMAAGVRGGDLIVAVNGTRVAGRADAVEGLGKAMGLVTLTLARKSAPPGTMGGGGGGGGGGGATIGYVGVD